VCIRRKYIRILKNSFENINIDFADSYPELEDEAKDILRVILKSSIPISVSKIRKETGLFDYKVRKWPEILDEKKAGTEDEKRTGNKVRSYVKRLLGNKAGKASNKSEENDTDFDKMYSHIRDNLKSIDSQEVSITGILNEEYDDWYDDSCEI